MAMQGALRVCLACWRTEIYSRWRNSVYQTDTTERWIRQNVKMLFYKLHNQYRWMLRQTTSYVIHKILIVHIYWYYLIINRISYLNKTYRHDYTIYIKQWIDILQLQYYIYNCDININIINAYKTEIWTGAQWHFKHNSKAHYNFSCVTFVFAS